MNRVLGEDNHVATCVWQKRYSRENRGAIGDAHEYLLIFAINPVLFKVRRNKISLTEKQISVYKNIDPVHGRWRDIPMSAQGFRLNQMYEIVAPNGKRHTPPEGRCWSTVEPQYLKLFDQGRIYFGKDGNGTPRIIRYLSEVEGVVPWTWWPHEEVGHTDEARKEIQDIFGTQTAFDTPKPVRLIERILRIATKPNDLVVDFFAGSGTTAHAVMKLNAEDGGNRRFILVSNTEVTDAEPGKNLCRDVCAERVRRVMRGYTNKKGEAIEGLSGDPSTTLRTGFAYLRTRRIPAEAVLSRIEHEQVWIALQLIHTETLQPYATGSEMQTAELPDGKLAYCTKVNEEILGQLLDLAGGNGIVVVYSWQPGWLRQYLPNESITVEQIPAFLINRFGGDYAA